ncbi:hypothetical protein B0H19DRAFT_1101830 [Mycena capillaripes]|nr:hypothetical protein B0H19DRAFT_1101830 [Mycena capillaripes]
MFSLLSFAALLLPIAVASPITHVTSATDLTSRTTGTMVRIIDNNNFNQVILDTNYPQAPEFTPLLSAVALPHQENVFELAELASGQPTLV